MPNPGLAELIQANQDLPRYQPLLLRSLRRVAPFLAWLAIRLRVSPFHINFFNFFLGISACAMFALGPPDLRVAVAILLIVWQLLDATDGNIARGLGVRSNYGGFIDYLGGMFLLAFLHISIGVGLFRSPEHSVQGLLHLVGMDVQYLPAYSLMIGGYCSVMAILFRLSAKIVQLRFGVDLKAVPKDSAGQAPSSGKRALKQSLHRLIKNLDGLGGLQLVLLLVAASLGWLEVFLAFYLMVNMVILTTFTGRSFLVLKNRHAYR